MLPNHGTRAGPMQSPVCAYSMRMKYMMILWREMGTQRTRCSISSSVPWRRARTRRADSRFAMRRLMRRRSCAGTRCDVSQRRKPSCFCANRPNRPTLLEQTSTDPLLHNFLVKNGN
jgi:hypothetical protein